MPTRQLHRAMGVVAVAAFPDASPDTSAAGALSSLIQRVARGDQGAFAHLYDELAPMVFGVVRKVVRDPAQSEEVTQEVFVELWRSAPRFDASRSSVRAWAAMLAHRRAVDRVRSEEASRRRDAVVAAQAVVPHDVVVAEAEVSIDQLRVRHAMNVLTDVQREAVELAYFGGRSYHEVAALLKVPEGTVKTRIRDGMIKLRDELGGGP